MNPQAATALRPSGSLPIDRLLSPEACAGSTASTRTAWAVLALLLVSNLPLFWSMPLTADTVLYDLQARNVLNGGVAYRDLFEPNLPGAVWVHVFVRSVLGSSSQAMRFFDICVFSGIVWLLTRWLRSLGRPVRSQVWLAVFLYWFYFSMSAWCHCQRDTWMLLPGLGALFLRHRQSIRMVDTNVRANVIATWAVVEGLCWAAAFWIKPFIAIPALACVLVTSARVRRPRVTTVDCIGLLTGGLLLGGLGILWLRCTNAWPYFIEILLEWNPRYFAAGKERWTAGRFLYMAYRFHPWLALHLVAVPVAMLQLARGWRQRTAVGDDCDRAARDLRGDLLAAFYLGWLIQSFLFQHLLDYIHVPAILLAITVLAIGSGMRRVVWNAAVVGFVLLALSVSPATRISRLSCWSDCLANGSTPELRDRLTDVRFPHWQELQPVVEYLRQQNLRDGELTTYNVHLVHLYPMLDLQPSTRFVFLETISRLFPDQRRMVQRSLERSRQRFVVTELIESGMTEEDATAVGPAGPHAPPPAFPTGIQNTFPWSHPVVFRSGRYLVHKVTSATGELRGRLSTQEPQPSKALDVNTLVSRTMSLAQPTACCPTLNEPKRLTDHAQHHKP